LPTARKARKGVADVIGATYSHIILAASCHIYSTSENVNYCDMDVMDIAKHTRLPSPCCLEKRKIPTNCKLSLGAGLWLSHIRAVQNLNGFQKHFCDFTHQCNIYIIIVDGMTHCC